MKNVLFFCIALIYQCTGTAFAEVSLLPTPSVVVQSYTITSLYGQQLIRALGAKDVVYLEHSPRKRDVDVVLSKHFKERAVENVTLLGNAFEFKAPNIKHVPLLSQIKLNPQMFGGPIYLISDSDTPLAKLRSAAIKSQLPNVTESFVNNEYELRNTVRSLSDSPNGYIFLNVFNFQDSWGQNLSFKDAEKVILEVNRKHVDVGICHADFKTALAVGPAPGEVANLLLDGTTTDSVCASLPRLKQLDKVNQYALHMGEFYRVVAPDY